MAQNLADNSALLVHPAKAFILRHIPVPERYEPDTWNDYRGTYYSRTFGHTIDSDTIDSDLTAYLSRLHASVETLFGTMDFELHHARSYPKGELPFHTDLDYDEHDDTPIRLATCVHNATDTRRSLHFARPDWTNHVETFALTIPPHAILAFSGSLITDYEHGIPFDPSVLDYHSIVTRFALWP